MRGFDTRSKEPTKLSFRQLIQIGIQDRSNAFNRFENDEQSQSSFKAFSRASVEVEQILEGCYRWLHQEEKMEQSTFHLLTSDGSILKYSSNGTSVEGYMIEQVMPSGGWFVGDLPIPLPESCDIQGSAIVCSEDAAVGLRSLTALLLEGVENDA